MERRTMMRELDEVIARAQTATAREAALVDVLPDCDLRHRKQEQVRTMRAHVHRLQRLRSALRTNRPPGSRLN
jgi:hypothetical protein